MQSATEHTLFELKNIDEYVEDLLQRILFMGFVQPRKVIAQKVHITKPH